MKCDAFESLCRKEAKVLFHAKIPFNGENYFKKRSFYNNVQLQNFPNSYIKRVLIIRIMIEKNRGRYNNPLIQNQILLSA